MRFNGLKHAVLALALVAAGSAYGADYTVDTAHSALNFRIKHLLSKVSGRFTDWTGTIQYDPTMKTPATFNATIKTASITTDHAKRDEHLKSPDFFDAAKNPEITFKSTKVAKKSGKNFDVTGDLTMAGKTKPVTLQFEYLGEQKDPWGNMKAGFAGKTTINRKDWGIVWNKTLDAGGVMLGDQVEIEVLLEADPAKKSASL